MRKFAVFALSLSLLASCNSPTKATQSVPLNETADLETSVLKRKVVQCVFTLDYETLDNSSPGKDGSAYNIVNTSVFENRLELLSGFDINILMGPPFRASDNAPSVLSGDDLSAIYVASYSDCDTSSDLVTYLAQKHLGLKQAPIIERVDAEIYINLAKEMGIPIDYAAFQEELE